MAKTNVDKVIDKLYKRLKDVTKDKKLLQEIGEFSVDRIQRTTRSGKDVDGRPLAPLASSTIGQRKYLEEFNNTHENYRNRRANLTFTGELSDALRFRISGNKINFSFIGTHKKYKTGKTRKRKGSKSKRITNAELAEVMQDGDSSKNRPARPFIGLNEKSIERIKRMVSKAFRNLRRKK